MPGDEGAVDGGGVGVGPGVVGQGLVEVAVEEAVVGIGGGPEVEGGLGEGTAGVGEWGSGPAWAGRLLGKGGRVDEVEGHALAAGLAEDVENGPDPRIVRGQALDVKVEDFRDGAGRP
ncbi:hypothetical protein [Streptomyces sp. NBC_01294]|uniref:hypothetical protein n=1 Tax=Streptomyces sp. NBC_01294 TaxID=2903815 RepID=UPI002DDB5B90|nr:hypothetical protein [Streptomyces sp. NBC_01294]WRZ55090.1 hypothetical protein OG534_00230 [Streptomyces sp. NBC_01294]